MKTPLLLLLVPALISPASADDTPAPSVVLVGEVFEVNVGQERSMPPTINIDALLGRGDLPTGPPTLKPTVPPTTDEMGASVEILIPGVVDPVEGAVIAPMPQVQEEEEEEEETPEPSTYAPTSSPPDEEPPLVVAGANAALEPQSGGATARTGGAAALLAAAAGGLAAALRSL